jgi:hypothetical protein
VAGLSDRDRQRLERGREAAVVKLARERRRVQKAKDRLARQAQQRQRLGPVEVVDPQGTVVKLRVLESGMVDLAVGPGSLFELAVGAVATLGNLLSHWLFFRGGSTVHVKVRGRKRLKIRMRSEDGAAECMQEIAEAVRHEGVAAVDRWRRRPVA